MKLLQISTTLKQSVKTLHFAFKMTVYIAKNGPQYKTHATICEKMLLNFRRTYFLQSLCKILTHLLLQAYYPLPYHVQWLVLNPYIIVRKSHRVKSGKEVSINKNLTLCLNVRHRASSIQDRHFATLHRTLFIYLINKYISLPDICLTVHH